MTFLGSLPNNTSRLLLDPKVRNKKQKSVTATRTLTYIKTLRYSILFRVAETRPAKMRPKSENPTPQTSSGGVTDSSSSASMDPIFHIIRILPFSFLRPPRLRLKLPSLTLPSANAVFALVLLTYFMVVSGIVYDIIVEPPGIGSTQDPYTGSVRPVVFMPGRVNGQYIIEGLSSGFMFVLGGIGIILLDLALDRNRARSVKVSYASAGITSVVLAYVMSMLFIRIKIPAYLR